MNLHDLTIKKFHQGLLDKKFSAAEIVKEYYNRIKKNVRKSIIDRYSQKYFYSELRKEFLKIEKGLK